MRSRGSQPAAHGQPDTSPDCSAHRDSFECADGAANCAPDDDGGPDSTPDDGTNTCPHGRPNAAPDDGGGTTLLEHVTLDEIVGHGGYAEVWRGRWMKSTVGVKVFRAISSPEAMRRVQAEAALLRTLRHPGVCYFFGTTLVEGGGLAIVMELLEGGTLGKYLGLDLHARDGQDGLPPSPAPSAPSPPA